MRPLFHVLFVLAFATFNVRHNEAAECNRFYGPAGTVHCVKISRYDDYQWAICRTDAYIKTTSKYTHQCEDQTRTYCHYQCMLDLYNKNNGAVLPHCSCSPSSPTPTEGVKLPSWCYSPSGTQCNWYRECLNKVYPSCENSEDDYAIKYAEKFCEYYNTRYGKFSSEGKKWVDAVRKCLQVKLVPLIDKTFSKTCAELKRHAFETHTPCYLNPDASGLSYCDLSWSDQWRVFWTINSAFYQAFWPSVGGLLNVLNECVPRKIDALQVPGKELFEKIGEKAKDFVADPIGETKKGVSAVFKKTEERIKAWMELLKNPIPPIKLDMFIANEHWFKLFKRRKRSTNDDKGTERSYFAGNIVDAIALQRNWKNKGIAWFASAKNKTAINGSTWTIELLLADRYTYETQAAFNSTSVTAQPANMTAVLIDLSRAVMKGDLNFKIDGERVEITKMNGCIDWQCKYHAFNITTITPRPLNAATRAAEVHGTIVALLSVFLISLSLLII